MKLENELIGPLYGVRLLMSLPLSNPPGSMRQALPGRSELIKCGRDFPRVAAGYEVVMAHYHEVVQNTTNIIEKLVTGELTIEQVRKQFVEAMATSPGGPHDGQPEG